MIGPKIANNEHDFNDFLKNISEKGEEEEIFSRIPVSHDQFVNPSIFFKILLLFYSLNYIKKPILS